MIYLTKEDRRREALAQEGAQALATIAGWETEPCPVLLPPALAGYPSERGGIVSVDIAADGSQIIVTLSDDGVGCPLDVDPGLGSKLVRLLAKQLGGRVEREDANPGCRVRVFLDETLLLGN